VDGGGQFNLASPVSCRAATRAVTDSAILAVDAFVLHLVIAASQSRLFWQVLRHRYVVLEDRGPLPMCQMAIFGTLDAIKGYTFRRSNLMNNQSRTLRRVGEGLLALVATGVSLLILQFALAA